MTDLVVNGNLYNVQFPLYQYREVVNILIVIRKILIEKNHRLLKNVLLVSALGDSGVFSAIELKRASTN